MLSTTSQFLRRKEKVVQIQIRWGYCHCYVLIPYGRVLRYVLNLDRYHKKLILRLIVLRWDHFSVNNNTELK